MAMYRTGTVSAPLTIIGKDLDAGATFNADVAPAVGVLRAGTFLKYDPATKTFTKATAVADVTGVLADDIDTGPVGTTEIQAAMAYRRGVFLRQEIESANNLAVVPGSADDLALQDKGIFLELSYEGYVGLNPIPAGVVPFGASEEEEAAGREIGNGEQEGLAKTTGPTTEPPQQ